MFYCNYAGLDGQSTTPADFEVWGDPFRVEGRLELFITAAELQVTVAGWDIAAIPVPDTWGEAKTWARMVGETSTTPRRGEALWEGDNG